ncbi:hypothetical protein [Streptomyces pseudoechinosporeus]
MVDLEPSPSLAHLALLGKEPMNQLVAPGSSHIRLAVGNDGDALSLERDPAEAGDQRFLPLLSLHRGLEAGPSAVRSIAAR